MVSFRWHLLTGIGVYYDVVFIEYLRLYIANTKASAKDQTRINLVWPKFFSTLTLPYIQTLSKEDNQKL